MDSSAFARRRAWKKKGVRGGNMVSLTRRSRRRRRRRDPSLPQLDLAPAVWDSRPRPAGAAAAELLVVYCDVGDASATL